MDLMNLTECEQNHLLVSMVPVGIYLLQRRDGFDYVQHCNYVFATLFGYDSAAAVIGKRMRDLHFDASRFDEFVRKVEQAAQLGSEVVEEITKIRTHTGELHRIGMRCRILRSHDGEVLGRVGVLWERSDEGLARHHLKQFTADIGNMLHAYSATLHTVVTSITPTTSTLLRNPGEHLNVGDDPLLELVGREAHHLAETVSNFVTPRAKDEHTIIVLGIDRWEWLKALPEELEAVVKIVTHQEVIIPAIYDMAVEVHDLFYANRRSLERNSVRVILNQAWLVERLCAYGGLLRARDAAVSMDYSARALREYVIRSERPVEQSGLHRLCDLIENAVRNVADFSREKRVLIDRPGLSRSIKVRVVERDVTRAFANLLHNAVKYSWSREDKPSRVGIRVTRDQSVSRSQIKVEIENYGVPIPGDEIDTGLIFRYGFRGRLAMDRRRTGTGIGLTDAFEIVQAHGGELKITSRPARLGASEADYTKPFITTAAVSLPVWEW